MQEYSEIKDRAENRKGGNAALAELLKPSDPVEPISELSDDRILSRFSRGVFQAGFNWKVVDNKWPNFERNFHGFAIAPNAMMSDEEFDSHLQNKDIIRNAAKILSIRDNAVFLSDLAQEHGSAAKMIAEWPLEDHIGLLKLMKLRGNRLGGMTGQYALRFLGRDCFILSRSVVGALHRAGVIDGPATSQKAQRAIQEAFNKWRNDSGESYTAISRTLAYSVDM